MARALKEAGAPDEQIDAAERAAELADRAAIRFKAAAESAAKQRGELVAAKLEKRKSEVMSRAFSTLRAHAQAARPLAKTAGEHLGVRCEMLELGMHQELAMLPLMPPNVYDASHFQGANPRITADHSLLDAFENEIERLERKLAGAPEIPLPGPTNPWSQRAVRGANPPPAAGVYRAPTVSAPKAPAESPLGSGWHS